MVEPGDNERCPECGALFVLVGRRHLCKPRARGRPPLGAQAMTPAERKRRERKLKTVTDGVMLKRNKPDVTAAERMRRMRARRRALGKSRLGPEPQG